MCKNTEKHKKRLPNSVKGYQQINRVILYSSNLKLEDQLIQKSDEKDYHNPSTIV